MNNKLIIIAVLVAIYFLTRKKEQPQKRESVIKPIVKPGTLPGSLVRPINPQLV